MTSGTRVYIGRISYDVRERDVEKFFKGYGRIREILLKDGFAFVEFDDQRDAEDAVYELNGKDLLGERVHVEFARGPTRGRGGRFGGGGRDGGRYSSYGSSRGSYGSRNGSSSLSYSENRYGPPRNTEYRVIVENLSSRVSWQDLKDFMRQAGEVTYADAHKREKNMGIVDFASYSDMKAALEKLDGHDLHGRRLRLHEDKSRRRRSHSRSRSPRPRRASKSRSRSRSRSVSKSRSRSMSSGRSKSRSRSSSPPPRRSDRGDAGDHKDGTKSPASRSSRSRSRSRSKSPVVAASNGAARREASGGDAGDRKNSHRSMSRSRSRSGSARSRSRSLDKSGSRSRSRSPMSRDSRSPSVHSDNSRHSGDAD